MTVEDVAKAQSWCSYAHTLYVTQNTEAQLGIRPRQAPFQVSIPRSFGFSV